MYKLCEAKAEKLVSSFIQISWPNVTVHMDRVFYCVFAFFTIAFWTTETEGTGEVLSLGIAVRQGEPASVITQKNGELVLNCSVEYEKELGPLSINWTKDGESVDLSTKRIQLLSNGSLYIRRIIHRPKKERSDGGQYRCVATLSKVGSIIAREVRVQVAGIDRKFEIEPNPQRVPVGGVARFQCKIQAVPPAMYFWERNGTLLPQDNSRYLFLSSGILQITGVRESDVGRYKCYVTQGSLHRLPGIDIDTKYSSEAALEIDPVSSSNQVKIVASSKNETALVESSALLECLVQGNVTAEWLKDGKSFTLGENMKRVSNNLLFVNTVFEDKGRYQCVVGNLMATMTLNIIQKPVILRVEPESKAYPMSQWIYLKCDVSGWPKPTMKWLKDGQDVPLKDKRYQLRDDSLVIVFSDVETSGYYQCVATNQAGSTMGYTRIKIYALGEKPEKPTNVTAISVTKNEIHVVWTSAATSPDQTILAYTVHYIKSGDIVSQNAVTRATELYLKELTPFSEYSIHVEAYTRKGAGPSSDTLVVRTLEDVPVRPPTITMVPGSSSILVEWSPLTPKIAHGIVVGYKLYYRRRGETQAMALSVPGSAVEYEIKGLEPMTMYEVRLNAGTSVGYNSFSDNIWPWVFVQTLDDMYVQLSVDSVNATAMNVSWVCEREAQWKQFLLEVRHLSKSIVSTSTLPPEVCHHVITGLEENSIYEVMLNAERVDGRTGQRVEEFRTSNVPLPPTPRSLHHTVVTTSSIGISWVQADSNIKITHFIVRYSQLDSRSNNFGVKTMTSDTSSALLENLVPFTQYNIAVQAHSTNRASKFSNPLIVRTKEGVPSEPQNIQIETVKPGHINVEWSPPAMPNGQIKSYIIMYTTTPTDDEETWVKVLKNGTEHSAVITITQTGSQPGTLYFKLLASTMEGPGKPSSAISVNTGKTQPVTDDGPSGEEQTTGIIIGISIGGFCIIICICIICCRHRILSSSYNQQPQTQPARFHGNGHIPGNGNGHAVALADNHRVVGVYEMEAYTPMLEHLPENEDSDSKGGGGGNVILTPNGTKLNGFVPMKKNGIRNGTIHNGHMTPFISGDYNGEKLVTEETRGLIASMLNGGSEQCMTTNVGDESFPTTRYEDLGSLDDIDHSSCEDVLGKSQEHGSTGDEQSGAGSVSASDRASVRYSDSMPRSDPGDKVMMCTSGCDDPTQALPSTGQGGMDGGVEEGTLDSRIEIPHSPSSLRSSSMCEDTYHDGGTTDSQDSYADSRLPQLQLTTSTYSQAPMSVALADDVTRSSSSSMSTPQASLSHANGEPAGMPEHRSGERVPEMNSSSNGFPPHLCCNWGQPQGDFRITSAENNPTIPHSPQPGEASLSHGSRETTLETLAQIPQDAVRTAAVNSSPWKSHYQV